MYRTPGSNNAAGDFVGQLLVCIPCCYTEWRLGMRHIHAHLHLVPAQVLVLDCGLREPPGQRGTDLLWQQQWRGAWSATCLCGAPWTSRSSKRT